MNELDAQRNDVSTLPRRRYAPSVTIYREEDGNDIEISVEYRYIAAHSGRMYGRQVCDPTPAEVELVNAYDFNGAIVDLTDAEVDQAIRLVFEEKSNV